MLNITLPVTDLRKVLSGLKHSIGRSVGLPILHGVRFVGNGDGTVTLTCTDLEQRLSVTVPGTGDGTVVVNHGLLWSTIQGAKGQATISSPDPDHVSVEVSTGTHELATLPVDEWPRDPQDRPAKFGELRIETERLTRVLTAAGTDDYRPILTGVFVDPDKQQVATTDSYRLIVAPAQFTVTDEKARHDKDDVIIPARFLRWVVKHAGLDVTVDVHPHREPFAVTRFDTAYGTWDAEIRLIDGTFPPFDRLLVTSTANRVVLPSSIVPALRRCRGDATPVRIQVRDEILTVEYRVQGAATSVLHSASVPGYTDGTVAYNPKYLADAIEAVEPDGDDVYLCFLDALKPMVMVGSGIYHLLMPVRTGAEANEGVLTSPDGPFDVPVPDVRDVRPRVSVAKQAAKRTTKAELVEFLRRVQPTLPDEHRDHASRLLEAA